MSIAAKCTCNNSISGICTGADNCKYKEPIFNNIKKKYIITSWASMYQSFYVLQSLPHQFSFLSERYAYAHEFDTKEKAEQWFLEQRDYLQNESAGDWFEIREIIKP